MCVDTLAKLEPKKGVQPNWGISRTLCVDHTFRCYTVEPPRHLLGVISLSERLHWTSPAQDNSTASARARRRRNRIRGPHAVTRREQDKPHAVDATKMPDRYRSVRGRYRPCCGGRCLLARPRSGDDASGASVTMILVPTAFILLPAPSTTIILTPRTPCIIVLDAISSIIGSGHGHRARHIAGGAAGRTPGRNETSAAQDYARCHKGPPHQAPGKAREVHAAY